MWKKDDSTQAAPKPAPRPDITVPRAEARPTKSAGGRATIGRSITIRGEVTGDEDLLIEGHVDGSVDLKQHSVTVGADGKVKANIIARVVMVEGTVEGDLRADEQVVLRSAAHVQGDITSPRVVLEDGATFRGLVDMGEAAASGKRRGEADARRTSGNAKGSTDAGEPKATEASAAATT